MSDVPQRRTQDMSPDKPSSVFRPFKPQRVLSCVLCQQRKIKCPRKFPCANCIKSGAQCVPASQRQRRRRFPERALLERLRNYEDLLRQHNIMFENLNTDTAREKDSLNAESSDVSDDEHPQGFRPDVSAPATPSKSEKGFEAKNVWHAMSQGFRDPDNDSDSSDDDVRETVVNKALDQSTHNDTLLLFGSCGSTTQTSTLHPDPVQMFRLWQIYVNNVNPLFKVTHTPSLQGRIIEAASDIANINHTLEAVMFGIYCTSVLSLTSEVCQTTFNSSKEDLLTSYQFGCQQALLKCGFLRSSDRDCLTAFYLYLVSVRPSTVPQSLSSMLGVAIRIAQRMGIHSESALAKCTPLEAEMRRRLWWSLVIFDTRVGEIANSRTLTLDPTWDCKVPLNVNDSDLRPEMKEPPAIQERLSEALYAVVRCRLADFIRHTPCHLDFTNPALKPIARPLHSDPTLKGNGLIKLEKAIEDQHLKYCDQDNPLHFLTIWSARAYLAKCRLLEHHSRFSGSNVGRTDEQRDVATSHALRFLECDTKIMASPHTKGFRWLNDIYFPFPAYIQIVQDLRRRPMSHHAQSAWETLSDNHEVWFDTHSDCGSFFQIFAKIVLDAWEAHETASMRLGSALKPPRIVSSIRHALVQATPHTRNTDTGQPIFSMGTGVDEFSMAMPIDLGSQSFHYIMGRQDDSASARPAMDLILPGQSPSDAYTDYFDWTAVGGQPGWGGC